MKTDQISNGVCKLDLEWVLLMKDAKELGLKPSEVKEFLEQFHLKKKKGQTLS